MRLIFLDIDGVLNSELWFKSVDPKKLDDPLNHFDPRCVTLLNNLVNNVNANVVISSSWRTQHAPDKLQDILSRAGLGLNIVGATPDLKRSHRFAVRGNEILQWCMDHESVIGCKWRKYHDYAILDDGTDFLLWHAENFFRTDPFSGLTLTVKRDIERFFERKQTASTKTSK